MEKSKKTLKMLGICIIGILIVVVINMLKGPKDPFKNLQGGKVLYQHIEEKNLLNNPQSDSYFVYFYEVGNKKCEKANEDLKKEMTIISNVYYFNIEDTTLKRGKDKKIRGMRPVFSGSALLLFCVLFLSRCQKEILTVR